MQSLWSTRDDQANIIGTMDQELTNMLKKAGLPDPVLAKFNAMQCLTVENFANWVDDSRACVINSSRALMG